MADGRILRGEVYWVCLDDSMGSEQMTGRPAVVISGNKANEILPTVMVAFMTSQGKPSPTNVSVRCGSGYSRVLCNQIRTIDKQRLTEYRFTLDAPELIRVTGALATAMCIPLAKMVKEEPAEDPEKTALKAECDMWKRLYNITMDQLVEIKVASELSLRMAKVERDYEDDVELEPVVEPDPEPEPEPEPEPPKVEFEPEPELTDINSCTFADLKHLGFSTNIALTIIEGRPYKSISDIRSLNGLTSIMYQLVAKKICCNPIAVKEEEPVAAAKVEKPVVVPPVVVEEPVVVEKVNINAATWKELMAKLGIIEPYACSITGHRRKNGLFTSLEELRNVKGLPKVFYERYKDRLTVGEVQVVEKPSEPSMVGKVNINTAKAKEIWEKLGCSQFYAYTITGYRNRNGRFVELAELKEVPNLPVDFLERYGDRIVIGDTPPVEEKPEVVVNGKVNVNLASAQEICDFTGLSLTACYAITGKRKRDGLFKSLDELVVPGRLSEALLEKYRDKMTLDEQEPVADEDDEDEEESEQEQESGKVNINSANIHQLMALGFEKWAAALIVNERKKFGNYRSVDELSEIPEISGKILRKLRDKLEV